MIAQVINDSDFDIPVQNCLPRPFDTSKVSTKNVVLQPGTKCIADRDFLAVYQLSDESTFQVYISDGESAIHPDAYPKLSIDPPGWSAGMITLFVFIPVAVLSAIAFIYYRNK